MRPRVDIDFKSASLKLDREAICRNVLRQFELPPLRLLCYLDDQNLVALQERVGEFLCGLHVPFMGIGDLPLPAYVTERFDDQTGDFAFDNLIYLCGRVSATEPGTVITLAHELQHFVQYGAKRKVWDANTLREWFQSCDTKLKVKPWDLPSEREAMIVSKGVGEALLGKKVVERFAEAQIAAGDDPQKWEFFLTLSASEAFSLCEETEKLIEALRGSCKGPDSLVAARERDHKRDERAKSRKLGARDR